MPFAIGGNQLDTGYDVSNSIRMDGTANFSDYTFGTSTNVRKRTLNFWVKRSKIDDDAGQVVISYDSSGAGGSLLFQGEGTGVGSNDQLFISNRNATSGSSDYGVRTNRLFRDVAAWYNIHIEYDTTQSTASNRIKIYVNGVQETSLAQTDYPSQNYDTTGFLGSTTAAHEIGRGAPTGSMNYFKGYFANFAFVDGTALDPTSFGEFNDNGVWVPIDPLKQSINFGNVGFFLEFKQSGSNQNASGQGADTSGNDNHLNPNNMGTEDTTTDTPTNNFCTLNPLSAGSDMRANGSFTQGNCELTNGGTTGEANGQKCQGTMGFANGKWYWEVKLISNTMTAGIVDSSISTSADINLGSKNAVTYDSETGIIANINGNVQGETVSSQYDDGDIIGVAVDADNGFVYFAKNNTYQNSGNPTSGSSGTGGASFTQGNQMLPLAADNSSGSAGNHQYNFGNAPFSISSGNADSEGHGNFEFAPPSGYFALCTKNLAEYG